MTSWPPIHNTVPTAPNTVTMTKAVSMARARIRPTAATKAAATRAPGRKLDFRTPGPFATDETWTDHDDATSYNNFYEHGTDKTTDWNLYSLGLRILF